MRLEVFSTLTADDLVFTYPESSAGAGPTSFAYGLLVAVTADDWNGSRPRSPNSATNKKRTNRGCGHFQRKPLVVESCPRDREHALASNADLCISPNGEL
jgi:hypothetical protein